MKVAIGLMLMTDLKMTGEERREEGKAGRGSD